VKTFHLKMSEGVQLGSLNFLNKSCKSISENKIITYKTLFTGPRPQEEVNGGQERITNQLRDKH